MEQTNASTGGRAWSFLAIAAQFGASCLPQAVVVDGPVPETRSVIRAVLSRGQEPLAFAHDAEEGFSVSLPCEDAVVLTLYYSETLAELGLGRGLVPFAGADDVGEPFETPIVATRATQTACSLGETTSDGPVVPIELRHIRVRRMDAGCPRITSFRVPLDGPAEITALGRLDGRSAVVGTRDGRLFRALPDRSVVPIGAVRSGFPTAATNLSEGQAWVGTSSGELLAIDSNGFILETHAPFGTPDAIVGLASGTGTEVLGAAATSTGAVALLGRQGWRVVSATDGSRVNLRRILITNDGVVYELADEQRTIRRIAEDALATEQVVGISTAGDALYDLALNVDASPLVVGSDAGVRRRLYERSTDGWWPVVDLDASGRDVKAVERLGDGLIATGQRGFVVVLLDGTTPCSVAAPGTIDLDDVVVLEDDSALAVDFGGSHLYWFHLEP